MHIVQGFGNELSERYIDDTYSGTLKTGRRSAIRWYIDRLW